MKAEIVSSEELKRRLEQGSGEFVAIFSTKWCGFCRALMGELERVQVVFSVIEVDISDDDDSAWDEYGISTVPTALIFRAGKEVARKPPGYEGLRVKDLRNLFDKNRA